MQPKVERYLKDEDMNRIDHALGHPVDPIKPTYREHFATDDQKEKAQFRASPFWTGGQTSGDMAFFFVTKQGRAALKEHLQSIGDKTRLFNVSITYDRETFSDLVPAETHGKARYSKYLSFTDCIDMPFGKFCKISSVQIAKEAA
ncbi:hypothetical protein [Pseudovibrio sp. Tun.PSC04-5.I4]|uniref:hypothetical protein n=1 Tax=Pseudovibrio sp. Tun.PSC04-5.I4 TaxID=1798213 RepID=UPI0008883863|nr:hypothetical protein [Pseudovibrio sp. Tun.PSC04-5.I4]SDQ98970.1 hypothetical protein SAMN04515695_2200 [Pseudovibrio sp. Tun.PSC04-5.I4]